MTKRDQEQVPSVDFDMTRISCRCGQVFTSLCESWILRWSHSMWNKTVVGEKHEFSHSSHSLSLVSSFSSRVSSTDPQSPSFIQVNHHYILPPTAPSVFLNLRTFQTHFSKLNSSVEFLITSVGLKTSNSFPSRSSLFQHNFVDKKALNFWDLLWGIVLS